MKTEKLITGIEMITLEDVSTSGDKRGPVFQWKNITDKKIVQITTYERKKGSLCGNHFHKGSDPSKNPELFMLASGQAELWAWNKFTKEEIKARIGPGTILIFHPHQLHKITALTDIVYVEPRITEFDPKKPDTYPAEQYEQYKK